MEEIKLFNNLKFELDACQDPSHLMQFTKYQRIENWMSKIPSAQLDLVPENEMDWDAHQDDALGFVTQLAFVDARRKALYAQLVATCCGELTGGCGHCLLPIGKRMVKRTGPPSVPWL